MNEEEKESINNIKNDISKPLACKEITICEIDDLSRILKLIEKQQKIIKKTKEICKEELAFERRLKRDNVIPDLFNQGKFYICDYILNIMEEK